jgi:hypothetical protein
MRGVHLGRLIMMVHLLHGLQRFRKTSVGLVLHGVRIFPSGMQRPLDLLLAQPFIRSHEDRHRAKDHAGKVECGGRHEEVERGGSSSVPLRNPIVSMRINSKACSKNGHRQRDERTAKTSPVEQHRAEVHWLCEASEVEMGRFESARGHREMEDPMSPLRRHGQHAPRRYERREGDLARRDRTQQHGGEDGHGSHRVPWLSILVHVSYPGRKWEHAVARDGKDELLRGHHGYACISERV